MCDRSIFKEPVITSTIFEVFIVKVFISEVLTFEVLVACPLKSLLVVCVCPTISNNLSRVE